MPDKEEFGLPDTDFFRDLQNRLFLNKREETSEIKSPSQIERCFVHAQLGNSGGKMISKQKNRITRFVLY